MKFSSPSVKKRSAAAAVAAAVLGLSGAANAAGLLNYKTSFEQSPDFPMGNTYVPGALVGQNGWVNETGEAASGATVINTAANTGLQSVNITTTVGEGYTDVYNSHLGDHNGVSFDPDAQDANFVNIQFAMNVLAPTNGQTTAFTSRSAFGFDVLDQNDQIIASLFAVKSPSGDNDLEVTNGGSTADTTVLGDAGTGRPDGTWGTYHLDLNFNNKTFTILVDGNGATATFNMNPAEGGMIGGFAFASDGKGANSALFDDLQLTPEPASIAMIGIGGLLFLAKRPRRLA